MQGWQAEDWTALRTIATDPEVMRYINDGQPWPDLQIREFVQRQMGHLANHGFCLWKLIDKRENHFLGFCGLQPLVIAGRKEVEIGWWLARAQWGQGLATEAAQTALQDGFERAGLTRVIAIAQSANRASTRIMEKIGMHYERDVVHKGINVVLYSVDREQ
jgi:RimJ/RimL family protein N-acetyltransferase